MQALKMEGITKTFPNVRANDDITFSANQGEILAIVGENGAGKSTLMSILYGHYRPDAGNIYIGGVKQQINSPEKAISLGIGMVFQHFMLVPTLSVYENIILGREPLKHGMLDKKSAIEICQNLVKQYSMELDVTKKVGQLSLGVQQKVEILKTLYRKANILILDEPTAVLAPNEVGDFFDTMRDFAKNQGKTIIFITHKLNEVMALADRITVIRKGKVVDTVQKTDVDHQMLAQMMVGRSVVLRVEKEQRLRPQGKAIVVVKDLSCGDPASATSLKDINFSIGEGEILGVAGIEGNGQTALLESLIGLQKHLKGSITVSGTQLAGLSVKRVREQGVIHIPEDRHKRGLLLEDRVKDNLVLGIHDQPPFARGGIRCATAIEEHADHLIAKYDIRGGGKNVRASTLSGGNQQKIVIAREFEQEHHFLVAAQPTRGVDVGSIEFIHQKILETSKAGKAVLLISADLQEILTLSDRIAVLYEGRLVGIVEASHTNETQLGLMMTGVS